MHYAMPLKFFTCWTSEPEKRASFIIHDWGRGKDRAGEVPVGHIEARQPLLKLGQNETQIEYISGFIFPRQESKGFFKSIAS